MMEKSFPVGFYEFHKDTGMNFQLNRFYSLGIFDHDEMMKIGNSITDFHTWIQVFTTLGREAEDKGDNMKSATCYRAAQFYALGEQRDENGCLLKNSLYEKCIAAYTEAYADEACMKYERIPFQTGYLPVYCLVHPQENKGTIVMHGGYDSLAQEFLGCAIYLHHRGYNIYFFEGPGQGEVLYRCHIKMTHEWEHCVQAVLDYYQLEHVTLMGISLGGYLATRAAAYEPRIDRLVMYDLIYDFYGALRARMNRTAGRLIDYLTNHPGNLLWKPVERKMNRVFFLKWLFEQGYSILENVHTPCEYFNCIKQYNTRTISARIKQDTLVLAGEGDIYTVFLEEQLRALTNAKSVESRLFTKAEHADHHCQIGNIKLVLDVIADWVERKQ